MEEEQEKQKNEEIDNSDTESDNSQNTDQSKKKKKQQPSNLDIIKYFDPFREILGPDELLEYKGVHFKIGQNTSKLQNLYGRMKPKNNDYISRSIFQADLGGEKRFKTV